MIRKWYEVSCDFCGATIDHYPLKRPTREQIEKSGGKTSATKQFCCEECWGQWNHEKQYSQWSNLKQNR